MVGGLTGHSILSGKFLPFDPLAVDLLPSSHVQLLSFLVAAMEPEVDFVPVTTPLQLTGDLIVSALPWKNLHVPQILAISKEALEVPLRISGLLRLCWS